MTQNFEHYPRSRFYEVLQGLERYLHSPDPDVFYLAKQKMERLSGFDGFGVKKISSNGSKKDGRSQGYLSPSQKLMEEIGVSMNSHMGTHVVLPATAQYWCDLGGDCSPSGRLMTQYCLGLREWPAEVGACGESVESFYQGGYLSRGQKEDVALLSEWIEVYYGKE